MTRLLQMRWRRRRSAAWCFWAPALCARGGAGAVARPRSLRRSRRSRRARSAASCTTSGDAGRRRDRVGARRDHGRARHRPAGPVRAADAPPGSYLVRAHLSGYVAPRAQARRGPRRARARSPSSTAIVLGHRAGRRCTAGHRRRSAPAAQRSRHEPHAAGCRSDCRSQDTGSTPITAKMAWRLRHARRGVLKDAAVPDELTWRTRPPPAGMLRPDDASAGSSDRRARLRRTSSPSTPFSGQVNLLTTSSFDTPAAAVRRRQPSRAASPTSRSARPAGEQADWIDARRADAGATSRRGFVAGSYATRAPATHQLRRRVCPTAPSATTAATRGAARRHRRQPQRRRRCTASTRSRSRRR